MKLPVGFWQGRTPAWTLCWPPLRERLGWKAGKCQLWHLQCTHLPSNRLLEIGQANRTVTGKAILNPVLTVDPRPKLKTADLQMFINSKPKRNGNHLHSPWEALKIGTASRLWVNGDNIDEVACVVDYSDLETLFTFSFCIWKKERKSA